ncbi:MmgE/PrpD family protein [Salipiger sp. P9]|uniref:MmgE/PrpD family protein n=1 Tax=Salipiger pentaromativorans TaxID=2943193 RepID=UPI00215858F8|nr:MmgE/PrpD family protein [Salipiger pentaromativorans]MCR8547519.1 MmgE/PrpD family protein [Salipiger pentaromativorans]
MSGSVPLATAMAGYFAGAGFASLSDARPEAMTIYVLDTLAVALGGSGADSSLAIRRALSAGAGPSVVYGAAATASAADAALLNGTAAHALELDDDHRVSVMHPGAVVVPAAFAMAEAEGATGRDLLRAVLAGYEVAIRVGMAYEGRLYANGFHPTAVCGVFGAAAAAAVILGLDETGFARAMGIAGTQAAGLIEWRMDGSWIKRLHPGRSAQSGVLAALLAREGFTGPATVFEGAYGVFKALGHGAPVNGALLTEGLGSRFHALGTAIKPYPCCRFSHGAIDLARQAHAELGRSVPEAVTVRLFRTDVLTYHKRTPNTVDAQFNIPYLVSVALRTGEIGLGDFTQAAIERPEILDLAAQVEVIEAPEFTALYPETYITELEIRCADGRVLSLRNECPSGDPEAAAYRDDPDLLRRETVAKARSVLTECGYGARAEDLIRAVLALPGASDVREVSALLAAPAEAAHPT